MTNVANSVIGGVSAAMPTTNELWGLFGVDPGSAPASLLEAGLGSYDLSEATKSVSVELGPGWFFMLAAAAAAATWACWAAFVPPSSRKTVAQPRPDDGDASERGPLISGA
ncbi:hypothetical protein [Microbacterium sp. NPDC076895]|uniref:hypothetical protein n=1 Tax=Microbacterium sp. NPDC076895 TaxID=3154957 RepID=UPI00344200E7